MNPWRKVFLRAAGFGVGIVAAVAIAIGAWIYIASLPQTPGPWDREKIKADFADLEVNTGNKLIAIFRYTVENTTRHDYHLPDDPKSAFVVLSEGKGLSQESEITWDRGAYLPPGQKISVSFRLAYDYNDSYPKQDRDNLDKLGKFMKRRLKETDGFVILDKSNRYEIVFLKVGRIRMKRKSNSKWTKPVTG
jgi:hypothetical protein